MEGRASSMIKRKRVSGSRSWCKVCRVWLADNKVQRQQHEQAPKHREALRTLLTDIARKNEEKAKHSVQIGEMVAVVGTSANAAKAKSQLLNSVANASETWNHFSAQPSQGPNEGQRHELGGLGAKGRNEEILDANGFPPPAEVHYGQWQAVEEVDGHKIDNVSMPSTSDKVVGKCKEIVDNVANEESGEQRGDGSGGEMSGDDIKGGERDEPSRAEIELSFKRRTIPRTRRVRRTKKMR